MWNRLFFLIIVSFLCFCNSAFAQNIKAKDPNNQNVDVRATATGYLITSPSGGAITGDVRLRDGTTATNLATVSRPSADDIDPLTVYGLTVSSGEYCLDATGRWDRIRCGSQASTNCQCISPPNNAYFMVSATTAANSAANPIYTRLTDGTNALDATHPLPVSPTAAANVQANPFYCAVSKDTSANAVTDPIWGRISVDGTNAMDATHPLPVSATMAANAVTNPIYNRISVDGTNAMDSTHPLSISATNAANTALNPIYMYKSGAATYSPAKTTTASVAGALVDVLASVEVLGYINFCVTLKNNDAANPFTDAAIFQSPDNSSWESLNWTACDTLAAGTLCSYCVSGNAYRYIKAQAKADVALTVSSVDAWLTANVN